ncbi:MAG: DUF4383 domain-containing protein [Actinomycetota bacterium]|nr:DUF4383 domain-containing protein [Actinomycetota bacterium]
MARDNAGTAVHGRELPQLVALGFAAVYVVVGLVGFLVTGFSGFAEPNTDRQLLGFELNPFHNVGHLVTGMTGLLLARTLGGARAYGWVLVASHVGLLVFGLLYANQDTPLNFFSFNVADNVLHVGVILVGLVIALLPARGTTGMGGRRAAA